MKMVRKPDASGLPSRLASPEMDASEVLARLDSLPMEDLLGHLSATRRDRADAIQRLYSCPDHRLVAEELIQLEIDDHARNAVITLLTEQQRVVGL